MSVLIGASRIQDKHGHDYRLQWRPLHQPDKQVPTRTPYTVLGGYRFARNNGWHCGHWHATPEDALACAIAKGATL